MAKLDFKKLKADLLARSESTVPRWLPDGKREGDEWVARNPMRSGDDKHPTSFRINLSTGVWKDFALQDASGSDLVSLFAYLNGYAKQGDAAKHLLNDFGALPEPAAAPGGVAVEKKLGGRPKWIPQAHGPTDPPADYWNKRLGKPVAQWIYRDVEGRAMCGIYRFNKINEDGSVKLNDLGKPEKEFCPLTWCHSPDGSRKGWAWTGLPVPRPLYHLDRIAANPDAAVVLCEGEKSADAAAMLFPRWVCSSTIGGARNTKHTDVALLRGRRVMLWGDNDDDGLVFNIDLTKRLLEMGCEVAWVKIPEGAKEKWDAADAVEEGWTAARVAGLTETGQMFEAPKDLPKSGKKTVDPVLAIEPDHDYESTPLWPVINNWRVDKFGVHDISGQLITLKPIWIDALTMGQNGDWGIRLVFVDHNWNQQSLSVSTSILGEQGGVLGKELLKKGFPVVPGKEKWLSRYLNELTQAVKRRIHAAGRLGWYDNPGNQHIAFIMPSEIIAKNTELELTYQPDGYIRMTDNLKAAGTLEDWQKAVSDPCKGNPFLMFSLLMGLAGPMLKIVREATGGFHFYGTTTAGKTTMLQVAASCWGCGSDPQQGPEHTIIQSWDTSASALEESAILFNDMTLLLDEISKADAEKAANMVYKLTGGMSKARALPQGGMREQKFWRCLAMSTGEISQVQVFHKAKQEYKGGQRVRFPDIPIDDAAGKRAIVIDTHGTIQFSDSDQVQKAKRRRFVDDIKLGASTCYGIAGPMFTAYLIAMAEHEGWADFCAQVMVDMELLEQIAASKWDGKGSPVSLKLPEELMRTTRRFALVGLAGFYASQAKIIDWSINDIAYCIRYVRDSWLSDQGDGKNEVERSIEHFSDALIKNTHRFGPIDKADLSRFKDLIGYTYFASNVQWYAITKMGMRDLTGDFDSKLVLQELKKRGLLWHDKDHLTHKSPAISSLGGSRVDLFFVSANLFEVESTVQSKELDQPILNSDVSF